MDKKLLDLYTDYLLSSFSLVTATGLSAPVDGSYSQEQVTRFLGKASYDQKQYWQTIKPALQQVENEEAVLLIDDTIEEKPYTDENDIVCYHYDHSQNRRVKGINLINFVYHTDFGWADQVDLPVAFEVVTKTETYTDKKTSKQKRRSAISKNERMRNRLKILVQRNRLKVKYILWDSWFSSKENMTLVKVELKKEFVTALKANRTVALSEQDKRDGQFSQVSDLDLAVGQRRLVYLKSVAFPVVLVKQVFINKDGSTGTLYLVSSDTSLSYLDLTTIYQKRWNVETFHKSLKQHPALENIKIECSQRNHIFASMLASIKFEQLRLKLHTNHFALKAKLYLKALQAAFDELQSIQSSLPHSSSIFSLRKVSW